MKRAPSRLPAPAAGPSPALLLRPGLERWELWRFDGDQPEPLPLPVAESAEGEAAAEADPAQPPAAAELPGRVALAVPVRHLLALRLEQPDGTDPGEGVGLELEARGLVLSPEPARWTAAHCGPPHPAKDEASPPTRPVAVLLLGDEAIELARALDASEAAPAPLTLPLPSDGLLLLRELGRPVAIVVRSGQPVHAQALGSPHWDRAAALELRLLLSALVSEGILTRLPEPATLIDSLPPDAAFAQALGLAVQHRAGLPAPRWPGQAGLPQLPHRIEQAARSRRRRTVVRMGALVALAVLGWLGALGAQVVLLQLKRNRLDTELGRRADLVRTLSDTDAEFVNTIGPLLSGRSQPLELQRTVQTLKPPGVRFERFIAGTGKMEIQGYADTSREALEFQSRLQAAAAFSGWTWQSQQPTFDGGRASFRFVAAAPKPEGEET